ncbi:oligosaccharide flippase family protein [Pseudarthrobacter sp. S3]|uniref:oligosaccharide flippase family protein n=1 Tax=Pseudarthrobacter sp. S3 TaxID=3418419 RepID=UPI003CECE32F
MRQGLSEVKQLPSVGRGIAISTIGNLGAPLVALISAPILAQSLGVTSRGEVAAATAPLLLAVNAITLGLPEAITYFTASGKRDNTRVIAKGSLYLVVLGLAGSLALWVLAPMLAPPESPILQAMSLAALALAPSLLLGGIRAYAAGQGRWALISIERFFSAILRLVAFLVLVALDSLTVLSASVTIAVSSFVGLAIYLYLLRKGPTLQATSRVRRKIPLFSYGTRVWVGALTGILLSRLDQVLMIPLSTAYQIGLYAVAVSISEVTLIFNSAVRDVLFSAESVKANDSRLTRASRVSTFLTLLGAILVGVSSVWLVPVLFGDDFAGSVIVVEILLLGVLLGNPGSVAGAGLSARGRPGLRSVALSIAFAGNLCMVFLLVPSYGAIGAAWATLLGNVTAGVMCVIFMRTHFKFSIASFYGIRSGDLARLATILRSSGTKTTSAKDEMSVALEPSASTRPKPRCIDPRGW